MPFAAGSKLGPYEIIEPLGAGGMGEVYRAVDTRLDRFVAIKVLPDHLSAEVALKQRLEREARAISQLQHPHICTLHDIGQHDGTSYLVMELLDGETLAQRLERGPLPLAQLFKIGVEIADALDKAHRQGIIHRDLKPGNIMLTSRGAKLMDFGLAKPSGIMSGAHAKTPTFSAAITVESPSPQISPLTTQGTIVGTVQYMAPEQIEGREADARSDIFALGAVLYEMATAKRAFEGKSQLVVASAILEKDPEPISSAMPRAPAALDHVVQTCLAKEPEKRFQSAHDVKLELEWIAATPARPIETRGGPGSDVKQGLGWALAALFLIGLISAGFVWYRSAPPDPLSLAIVPIPGVTFNFSGLFGPPAISPDGSRIVVTGADSKGARMLYLRTLRHSSLQPLAGTEGATYPFWSPDGRHVGFFASDRLKVANIAGGPVAELCRVTEGRGGTWNGRGEIVFGSRTTGLFRIPATGGTPTVLTKLQPREANHRFPVFAPDGEHIVFVVQYPGKGHAQWISLKDAKPQRLEGVNTNVNFSFGRIFHYINGALVAQKFDASTFSLGKEQEMVAKPVAYDGQFNYAAFAVSESGVVAYEESTGSASMNELVWMDRTGKQLGTATTGRSEDTFDGLRLSPRGDRLVYNGDNGQRNDVWVMQVHGGMRTRISLGPEGGSYGVWSPTADRLVYQNGIAGDRLFVRASNGVGNEQLLANFNGSVIAFGWPPPGDHILVERHSVTGNSPSEIWVAAARPGGPPPHPIVRGVMTQGSAVSLDGKWLAYTSDESGRPEIYVVPFWPDANPDTTLAAGRWQISSEGGVQPRWSAASSELFFIDPAQSGLYAATIRVKGGEIESGVPKKVVDLPLHPNWRFYDLAPNGNIYMLRYVGRESSPLTIMLNWRPAN
jgi:eukaryotic-like serine/threonine-protein kinase